jgi:two-component system response regulator NreC
LLAQLDVQIAEEEEVTKLRILLAEDHAILREGIRSLLASGPDLEVVGEAEDGLSAVTQTKQLQPDLALVDLSLPLMNGTEAIRQIKQRAPATKVIVLTVHKSDEHVRAALDAGAAGYVLKDDHYEDLMAAIRSVVAGGTYLSPKICGRVVSGYLGQASAQGPGVPWDTLTDREREVVKLVAEGYKNREIAGHLCVSLKTVEKHRANVMRKLDLHSVAALTAYAFENGLVAG